MITYLISFAWLLLIAAGLGIVFFIRRYFMIWLRAYVSGVRLNPLSLVFMSLRRVNPQQLVLAKIMMKQAGLPDIPTAAMESQYLAGGNVERITKALIATQRARIELDWTTACVIDLAGRDVLEAVRVSVNPLVIDCPDPAAGRATLDGVAKDGIQLKVNVRVTVRMNLSHLVGGATERTVIARVGQGIVSAIGSCETYRAALADPLMIARKALNSGVDSGTAFEILSIDIADITVGENLGAKLMIDQARANIRIARAVAEQRRAMAAAHYQEMVALTQENKAKVVAAEAHIPTALGNAFRDGKIAARTGKIRLAKDYLKQYSP